MKTRMSGLGALLAGALLWGAGPAWAARAGDKVDCRIELDRGVLPAGSAQKAVVKITLDAPEPPRSGERPPVNLCVVLDRSGSMSGAKIEKAKEAAIEALRRLGERDRFSLVIYDDAVETIVPAESAGNTERIIPRIRAITARGSTALFAGVSQGAAEIRKHLEGNFVHRVILLSDGIANVGPSSPSDLGRLGAALMKEHIAVSTVGVGTDYNEDLMTQLSQASDGNSYFVEGSGDLPRIFAAELGDVLSVVARKVNLQIEFTDGTRPLRIIGRDGRLRDNRVEINLNQLYGGQEKFVLVEVELSPGAARATRRIAEAKCVYEDAVHQRDESVGALAEARFSEQEAEIQQGVNVAVQQDVIVNTIAEAKEKAVKLSDEGRRQEAAQVLLDNNVQIRQQAAQYNMPLPAPAAAAMADAEAGAQAIEKDGMSKSFRKSYITDSYQIRNQQQKQ